MISLSVFALIGCGEQRNQESPEPQVEKEENPFLCGWESIGGGKLYFVRFRPETKNLDQIQLTKCTGIKIAPATSIIVGAKDFQVSEYRFPNFTCSMQVVSSGPILVTITKLENSFRVEEIAQCLRWADSMRAIQEVAPEQSVPTATSET